MTTFLRCPALIRFTLLVFVKNIEKYPNIYHSTYAAVHLLPKVLVSFQEQNIELEKRITSLTEQILAANEEKESLKVRSCKTIYPSLSVIPLP